MPAPEGESAVGLCWSCRHRQEVRSGRGSTFHLCGLSRHDPRFARYPALPVRLCPGHQRITEED